MLKQEQVILIQINHNKSIFSKSAESKQVTSEQQSSLGVPLTSNAIALLDELKNDIRKQGLSTKQNSELRVSIERFANKNNRLQQSDYTNQYQDSYRDTFYQDRYQDTAYDDHYADTASYRDGTQN